MAQTHVPRPSLGERLQALPKLWLYAILLLAASVPLFFNVPVPNRPIDPSIDFYAQTMAIPDGSRVIIASDWTNSTRGESRGSFEGLLRLLMRKNVKFAVYSTGDPQAPQVARDVIRTMAIESEREGGRRYQPFVDYVVLGYFPNAEGTLNAINNNILNVLAGKKDLQPGVGPTEVLRSPVFQGVRSVADFQMHYLATASSTSERTVERIKKAPLMFMVTGVMVPENTIYYSSGQLKGLVGGVKGVYDLEMLMERGINNGGPDEIASSKYGKVPGWPGKTNKGKGTAYYLTLHFCLALLILAVVIGNVGMALARRGNR